MENAQTGSDHSRFVVLGHFTGLHGLKGWIKVFSHTDPRESIFEHDWWIGQPGQWQSIRHHGGRRQGKTLVVRLEGVNTPEQAEAYRDLQIAVPRDQLPEPDENSWYWADLEGLQVRTLEGVELGRVSHLFETGANDVMVVKGERERLVPFTYGHAVQSVDLEQGCILVDWDPDF